mmetsp:Transcript_7435/g.27978  ORF Transcript_7435/g.27978 Transcript_7435/m.27978 type:complete len:376 (+) Transcript_7435:193-1320(+)
MCIRQFVQRLSATRRRTYQIIMIFVFVVLLRGSPFQVFRRENEENLHTSAPLVPRSNVDSGDVISSKGVYGHRLLSCVKGRLTAEGGVREVSYDLQEKIAQWLQNAEIMLNCPELFMTSQGQVPQFLHRIWECGEIPDQYVPPLKTWLGKTQNMSVFWWTQALRRQLILKLEGVEKLLLYDRLLPGAYRADFFRYFILHKFGGMYSDVDTVLYQDLSAHNLTHLRDGAVTVTRDLTPFRLLNGAILITPPGHALFRCALGEVIDHSRRRTPGLEDLDVTGPGVLGECVRHILGQDELDFLKDDLDVGESGIRILYSFWLKDTNQHVIQLRNTTKFDSRLISLMQGGVKYFREVSPECDPGNHYNVMHSKGEIYST